MTDTTGTTSIGMRPPATVLVAQLGRRLSDRAIAAELHISPRTVNGHVAHILDKLDLDSRSAVAAFAVRNGLF